MKANARFIDFRIVDGEAHRPPEIRQRLSAHESTRRWQGSHGAVVLDNPGRAPSYGRFETLQGRIDWNGDGNEPGSFDGDLDRLMPFRTSEHSVLDKGVTE